jgi:hypothetical protein
MSGSNVCPDLFEIVTKILSVFFKYISSGSVTSSKSSFHVFLFIKILTNSNQQTQSYNFTSHIAAFLSVVLITEMLEICIQTSYDQNVLHKWINTIYCNQAQLYSEFFLNIV